jgi:hypothetical protein
MEPVMLSLASGEMLVGAPSPVKLTHKQIIALSRNFTPKYLPGMRTPKCSILAEVCDECASRRAIFNTSDAPERTLFWVLSAGKFEVLYEWTDIPHALQLSAEHEINLLPLKRTNEAMWGTTH